MALVATDAAGNRSRPRRLSVPYRAAVVADLVVYEKRTCTTCRKLAELLAERGIDFDRVEYHVEGLPEDKLRELLRKGGLRPADVLRRREPLVAELGLDRELPPDDELIALMAEHPVLVQRPIVERGDRAVLGAAGREGARAAVSAPPPPFTEELEDFRQVVRRFIDNELAPARARVGGREVVPERGVPAAAPSRATSG